MELGFKVWIQMGVVSIDASLVCLELLPNFHAKTWQHFTLFSWRKFSSTLPQVHHNTQDTNVRTYVNHVRNICQYRIG